ncbi:hypothetical protein K7H91_18180, partial [Martelella mediterranea]|uniref:hypothetical protein n=1 Tax=Martelella mediterranea TaxID=293089 RepID=UPI001E31D238
RKDKGPSRTTELMTSAETAGLLVAWVRPFLKRYAWRFRKHFDHPNRACVKICAHGLFSDSVLLQ